METYLGKLCPRRHEWESTKQSLRLRSNNVCVQCNRAYSAEWRSVNKEANNAASKAYYWAFGNKPLSAEQRAKNNAARRSPDVRERVRQRQRARYASDQNYRLRRCLRSRFTDAMKAFGEGKKRLSKDYGIDWSAIIERLGPCPGSAGHGPGLYEVDHIRPLMSFDLTDPDQIKQAFSPENHQWLIWEDHVQKSIRDRKVFGCRRTSS
jgi:hypothetical protein